jgi:putative endonuclease
MSSQSKVLYTGVTNDLERRVSEHKQRKTEGFTKRYGVTRLVWYESFTDINEAIECETRIKGWLRAKKVALIESMSSGWNDLAEGWFSSGDSSLRSE